MKKTLVIGIGNTGRADDGLGWEFVDMLADDERFDIVYRYQLQVEDADLIAEYDQVWFVDASEILYENGFECSELKAEGDFTYTTHELHPSAVLYLCHDLYKKYPHCHLLGISGDDWKLGHAMSNNARNRLKSAFHSFIQNYKVEEELSV